MEKTIDKIKALNQKIREISEEAFRIAQKLREEVQIKSSNNENARLNKNIKSK